MRTHSAGLGILSAGVLLGIACDGFVPEPPSDPPPTFALEAAEDFVPPWESTRVRAVFSGEMDVDPALIEWSSSDSTVIQLVGRVHDDPFSRFVRGVGPGSANVVARYGAEERSVVITTQHVEGHLPERVEPTIVWQEVSGACARSEEGRIFCRGEDGNFVPIESDARYTSVATGRGHAGVAHACALTDDGAVHCWGSNRYGQLGDGTTEDRPFPMPIDSELTFSAVAAGSHHSCALDVDGVPHCWGMDEQGQLGGGDPNATCGYLPYWCRVSPTVASTDFTFASLSAGGDVSCGIDGSGTGYCWGHGALGTDADLDTCRGYGRTGPGGGGSFPCTRRPLRIEIDEGLRSLAPGRHSCAVTESGAAYCWGTNVSGALGDGTFEDRDHPLPVRVIDLEDAERIVAAAWPRTCASTSRSVSCWGGNLWREMGNEQVYRSAVPIPVHGIAAGTVIDIGHSGTTGCAVTADGALYCWGL